VALSKSHATKAAPTAKVLVAQSVTRFDTSYFTLAEALKTQGYATGHFGKWHLDAEPYSALQQGFDVDFPHWPSAGPAGSYLAPWKFPAALNFLPSKSGEHIEDRMATEAIAFITAHKNEPFYVKYWAFSVYAPYDAKPELVEKYRKKAASLPAGSAQRNPVHGAMVQSLDDNVGRLLDTLDVLKLTENTILVFSPTTAASTGSPAHPRRPKPRIFPASQSRATLPSAAASPRRTKAARANPASWSGPDSHAPAPLPTRSSRASILSPRSPTN